MERNLERAGLSVSPTPNNVFRGGEQLGADYVVAGKFRQSASGIFIDYMLFDIAARRMIYSLKRTANSSASILPITNSVVREMMAVGIFAKGSTYENQAAPDRDQSGISNLTARYQAGSVKLTWDATDMPENSRYIIYRSESQSEAFERIGTSKQPSYRDMRANGNHYLYQIAVQVPGESEVRSTLLAEIKRAGASAPQAAAPAATAATAATEPAPPPAPSQTLMEFYAPTILGTESHVNAITLNIVPSLRNQKYPVTHYNIYRQNEGDWELAGKLERPSDSGTRKLALSYTTQVSHVGGEKYYYSVTAASSEGGESARSETASYLAPVAPQLALAADRQLRRVELSWSPTEVGTGYIIYRRDYPAGQWQEVERTRELRSASWVDSNVSDGSSYEYYLAIYDRFGETEPTPPLLATTKPTPAPPADLEAESGLVKTVKLTWKALEDTDVLGYEIWRRVQSDGQWSDWQQLELLKGHQISEYLDEQGLSDGQRASYRLAAQNTYGAAGEHSQEVTATTKPKPGLADVISAEASGNAIEVTWSPSPDKDIAAYLMFRQWNGLDWQLLERLPATSTSYIDRDLKPYAETRYRLVAEDAAGLSSDPLETEAIMSPLELALEVRQDGLLREIHLGWNSVRNVDGFALQRRTGEQEQWETIRRLRGADTNSFEDKKGLTDGTRYQYRLTAYDSAGETPPSNVVDAFTKDLPPPPDSFEVTSGLVKSVKLSWAPLEDPDVAGYALYRGSKSVEPTPLRKIKDRSISEFTDRDGTFNEIEDGSQYTYYIRAFNSHGVEGPPSGSRVAETKPVPQSVSNVTAMLQKGAILVSWSPNPEPDISRYIVQRANGPDCSRYREVGVVKQQHNQFLDDSSTAGRSYCYDVLAVDADEMRSVNGDSASVDFPAPTDSD
jgi:fibronectin type 3 domain-containing protein